MMTTESFIEPQLGDEVITPAMLPPSAASLTTKGRSLFNEVLSAIKTRQRVQEVRSRSGNSDGLLLLETEPELATHPDLMQHSEQLHSSHITQSFLVSETVTNPQRFYPSTNQVSSTLQSASTAYRPPPTRTSSARTALLPSSQCESVRISDTEGRRRDSEILSRDSNDSRLASSSNNIRFSFTSKRSEERLKAIDGGVRSLDKEDVYQRPAFERIMRQKADQRLLNFPPSKSSSAGSQSKLKQSTLQLHSSLKSRQTNPSKLCSGSCLEAMDQGGNSKEDIGTTSLQREKSGPLKDVRKMAKHQLDEVKLQLISQPHLEVACTLVYSDNHTQLRLKKDGGKGAQASKATGVALAYPVSEAKSRNTVLRYIYIPFSCKDSLQAWSRSVVLSVMSKARVICYRGQELVAALISTYSLMSVHVWLEWTVMDTSLAAWLLNPDLIPSRSFAELLNSFEVKPPPPKQDDGGTLENEIMVCRGLALLGPLMTRQYKKLMEENLWTLYEQVEVRLIPILAAMEVTGVQVNVDKLLNYTELLKGRLAKVEQSVHKAAGHSFVIHSTTQLRQVLFEELQLDKQCSKKLSKTQIQQHKSTSESVLVQLKDLHPLPGLILEYRQISKIKATYVTGILPFITEGTIRPHWQQTVAATGRLTSSMPNIQAFPKEPIHLGPVKENYIIGKPPKEVSVNVREAVESRPGFSYLAADFKSIELRLVAHLSEDPRLLALFNTREKSTDIFTQLASEWLGTAVDSVTQAEREKTKRVVYAVIYGVGKERLAEILNVDASIAKELRNSFLEKFPNIQQFITNTVSEAREKGCLSTIYDRKRWFPNLSSANPQLRSHAERQAVNFPVQGSAADLCKKGMIEVMKMLAKERSSTKLLLQIHDELIFEVGDEQLQEMAGNVKCVLESLSALCQLKVPLEVKISTGKNWAELAPL